MRFFIVLVIVAFAGMAVFGVVGMRYDFAATHSNCVAALAGGKVCPGVQRPLDFAAFHLGILKYFSTAFVVALVVIGFAVIAFSRDVFLPRQFAGPILAVFSGRDTPLLRKLGRWQAQHLHSPTD